MPYIPQEIYISKETWNEAKRLVKNGIIKKLSAAKQNIDSDTEIAAGIYIYALEEFGKLLLLKECQTDINEKYIIKYREGFLSHKFKFCKAFDYLYKHNSSECTLLNKGSFSSVSFTSESFTMDLLAQTQARLGIFHVDFESKNEDIKYDIMKIPNVNNDILNEAIYELNRVINTIEL